MHVRFSYQSELPRLPGTFRKKPHPQTMAGIAGGEHAGGPRPCRGRSARHGRTVYQISTQTNGASARFLAFQDLKRGRSAQPTRTVRDLVREHVFHPTRSATDRRTARRSDRTVRNYLFSTLSLIHVPPTFVPYVQSLYHSLALLKHAFSCH